MEVFDSLDGAQDWVLRLLLANGARTRTRGLDTLELFPVSFAIRHPRRRCVTSPTRRWNLPLALGEFSWHVSGSNELRFVSYYSKRWREFAEDGSTIWGSCYGHRIFKRSGGQPSQWEKLITLLKIEPQSRRAVLSLLDADHGLSPSSKDVACACTLQFLVRSGQLVAVVYMRSNDVIWGLPYDVFLFSMLQELLARELDLDLGPYFHFAGSLHLYERHFELAQQVIDSQPLLSFEMPQMETPGQLTRFLRHENRLRAGETVSAESLQDVDRYWRDLLIVLDWYRQAKDAGSYQSVASKIPSDSPYQFLLQNMVKTVQRVGAKA